MGIDLKIETIHNCRLDTDKLSSILLLLKTSNKMAEYYYIFEHLIEKNIDGIDIGELYFEEEYEFLKILAECMPNLKTRNKDFIMDDYITVRYSYMEGDELVMIYFYLDYNNKPKVSFGLEKTIEEIYDFNEKGQLYNTNIRKQVY